jgi:hypothetical protein
LLLSFCPDPNLRGTVKAHEEWVRPIDDAAADADDTSTK